MPAPAEEIVLAVLLVGDRYLMQLRDETPAIEAPGIWGLFGGRVERGERPADAMAREIREELTVDIPDFRFLWNTDGVDPRSGNPRTYWFYEADFTAWWGRERLTEGRAARCFSYGELAGLPMPSILRETLTRHRACSR